MASTTSGHSPEPWFYRKHLCDPYHGDTFRRAMQKAWYLGGSEDRSDFIADVFLKDDGNDEATMQRIIFCVNAMRGTSDPVAFMRQLAMAMIHLGNAEREITHWISGEEAARQPAVCKLIQELAKLRQFGEWEENS